MARIRTVKPSFFRHGELQDLEVANPGKHCMLVFAGLWGHCDRTGVFECDPRQLKLDLLPFLPFDMADTIGLLEQSGFLRRYEVNGKQYAVIPSFSDHQRIGGKEATEPLKHPREAEGKQSGSVREATGKHLPAQEVEGKGIRKGITTFAPDAARRAPKVNGHRVEFDPLNGAFKGISEEDELRWQEAYPAVPIPPAIAQAAAWLKANPANRKSNNERFLVNWFKREQDKAGRVSQGARR